MPTTSPCSRRSDAGSARAVVVFLLAVLMFAAGAATSWWYLTQRRPAAPPTPAPDFGPLTPSGTPSTPQSEATTPPSPEATPTAVADAQGGSSAAGAAPGARTPGKPRVAKPGPPVAANPVPQMLTQAESAISEKRFTDAAELYDRVLKLDPANEAARAGKARIASMGATRTFVLGTTTVESLRALGKGLEGFDTTGVGVKRAPTVDGKLELVMEPAKVGAGDPYAVKVFLLNAGKKPIDVEEMKVSMIVDGKWSTRPLPPKVKQIAPRQRVLLEELPGVWRAGVKDWAVEAVVTSKGQDVYRNRLTWK